MPGSRRDGEASMRPVRAPGVSLGLQHVAEPVALVVDVEAAALAVSVGPAAVSPVAEGAGCYACDVGGVGELEARVEVQRGCPPNDASAGPVGSRRSVGRLVVLHAVYLDLANRQVTCWSARHSGRNFGWSAYAWTSFRSAYPIIDRLLAME